MHRRPLGAAVSAALFIALPALASDQSCTRETLKPVGAVTRIDVASLFERKPSEPEGSMEVVLARIGKDGKPILACVDSAEAAKRFLEAPVERLATAPKEK